MRKPLVGVLMLGLMLVASALVQANNVANPNTGIDGRNQSTNPNQYDQGYVTEAPNVGIGTVNAVYSTPGAQQRTQSSSETPQTNRVQ